ncbi:MAG: methionine adenosyltransferase [Candidatus Levybacteria bacterium]|nr:methionine adenosyltransferase [Candidatus Levybacteria bacterium]
MPDFVFTSESVCAGHPDKVCDQISDAILDEALRIDPFARVAVETMVTENRVIIIGEVTVAGTLDYEAIARKTIKQLGYNTEIYRFSHRSPIDIHIHEQSREIADGVDRKGAGDQGMMFGYACTETKELMPLPIMLAHELAKKIDLARERRILPFLRPDGKTQVSLSYKNGRPHSVKRVIIAVPHRENIKLEAVKRAVFEKIVSPVLRKSGFHIRENELIVNGTGVWHIGGPASDSGLTGRKIVVDTYGGMARVGGGCFSGKDPTKVDRSGAYAARFIAKHIVAQGLADRAEVRLAYFIGAKSPLMQEIETFGTEKISQNAIKAFAKRVLNTSVEGIIETLNLRRPIYFRTASYGHFGREIFPWEFL